MLVMRSPQFCDDSLPTFTAGAFPGFVVLDFRNVCERRAKRKILQQRPTLIERQLHDRTAFEPKDVEYVVCDAAGWIPGSLSVENHVVHRQPCDCLRDRRVMLEKPVTRIKLHVVSVFEGKHPDSVELPLESPLGSSEPLLRQCRRHRHDPIREGRWFIVWHGN